jgi:hypothetical protein
MEPLSVLLIPAIFRREHVSKIYNPEFFHLWSRGISTDVYEKMVSWPRELVASRQWIQGL